MPGIDSVLADLERLYQEGPMTTAELVGGKHGLAPEHKLAGAARFRVVGGGGGGKGGRYVTIVYLPENHGRETVVLAWLRANREKFATSDSGRRRVRHALCRQGDSWHGPIRRAMTRFEREGDAPWEVPWLGEEPAASGVE